MFNLKELVGSFPSHTQDCWSLDPLRTFTAGKEEALCFFQLFLLAVKYLFD